MKKPVCLLILILFIWSSPNLFSQTFEKSYTNKITGKKITNKLTGEVIEDNDMNTFISNNPNVLLEPVYDRYGNIEAYEFDLSKTDMYLTRDETKRVTKGECFPPFVMKSISKRTIDSEKLRGHPILIQFHVSFFKPLFIENSLSELDSLVTNFRKTKILEAVVVTTDSKDQLKNNISINTSSFEIIPDGRNFQDRYLIINFPSTVLIDKEGKLVSYYTSIDMDKLKADLMELD